MCIRDRANVIHTSATVDWWRSYEVKRQMGSRLDDYLYDQLHIHDYNQIELIIAATMGLVEANHELFGK